MECYQLYHGRKRLRLQSPWDVFVFCFSDLWGPLVPFYSMAHSHLLLIYSYPHQGQVF